MEQEIANCLEVLRKGGTILYPTDTIWGIGCDATNPEAVEKVYSLKRRMETKSLIILLEEARKLTGYVTAVPDIAWDLIKHIDSPLTIIYPGARNLARNVIADDGTVGIGSGGAYAAAAARALVRHAPLDARAIAEAALGIASEICIYTNTRLTIEEL